MCQTDMVSSEVVPMDEYEHLKDKFEKLKKEYYELQMLIQPSAKHVAYDEDYFRGDNDKVRFFTGLTNWDILSTLFQFVKPHLFGHR